MAHYRSQSGKTISKIIPSTVAPSSAAIGTMWYNTATGITYQYTTDGASEFWLDISSGGIGTRTGSADIVGETDPHLETSTTGAGLAIGTTYYNRATDRYFTCTNTTTNGNQWSGRYAGFGGIETMYKSGTSFYRVHTFLSDGLFHMDTTTSCDILTVGGGGGGAGAHPTAWGEGGGGAGAVRATAGHSLGAKTYTITVGKGGGAGGSYLYSNAGRPGANGGDTFLDTNTLIANGGQGAESSATTPTNSGNGSGAGGSSNGSKAGGAGGTYGNAGGAGTATGEKPGGGGGAGGAGQTGAAGGAGGAGAANNYRTGSNITYGGGGGGGTNPGAGGSGGGGAGWNDGSSGDPLAGTMDGDANTGGGGGGTHGQSANKEDDWGGYGGSGIVVIRYLVA